jgi:hypothetical protein
LLSGCNDKNNRIQILSKCTILSDEAKHYGRANYLRLFHSINPEKFAVTYQKVAIFDNKSHRAMINTYTNALKRIKTDDPAALHLISSTQTLVLFVKNFVDHNYAKAILHQSKNNPKSDGFFIEINNIVKFDYNVNGFNQNKATFKGLLEKYNQALIIYSSKHQLNRQ